MERRIFLKGVAATSAALAAPRIASAQASKVLKFKPQADLFVVDPHMATSYQTRYLALLSYDTLYGMDNSINPHPQMVEGHIIENDFKLWRLKLRDGLRFHDGEPVLASDVVASIKRWGARDSFGTVLMAATDDMSAPSDREVVFRMKRPFPLLAHALAKSSAYIPAIMPARLISDPNKVLTEVVGSGPYRFIASERIPGATTVWEKFDRYVPRAEGKTEYTSGPKIAKLNRIEWPIIPDPSTATSALISGEIDWYEDPLIDLLGMLRASPNVKVTTVNPMQTMGIMRINHLHPPFDNPEIRRALIGAIDQAEIMTAVSGADPSMWDAGVGIFTPNSPMASDVGMEVLNSKRDYDKVKAAFVAAGYKGEKVKVLSAINVPQMTNQDQVVVEAMRRSGMNAELIPVDYGLWFGRRASKEPGAWNATNSSLPGLDLWDPVSHIPLRGNGIQGGPGWCNSPELEQLRDSFFLAPDTAARQAICRNIQMQAWKDVPYIPTGRFQDITAYRSNLQGVLTGMPLFYNVSKD